MKTSILFIFSLVFLFHRYPSSQMLSTLYIPRVNRVHMGHGEFMKRVFEHQGFAFVKSVEFFEHEFPNAAFGFAIVKVLFWIPGPVSKHFQQRLKDASRETRIVFSDPSYWIVLPYTEKQKQKQKQIRIPPPPLPVDNTDIVMNPNCICGCGGGELDCSSQILYNQFTDTIWTQQQQQQPSLQPQSNGNCRADWSSMNSMEDNFRFYDTPTPLDLTF